MLMQKLKEEEAAKQRMAEEAERKRKEEEDERLRLERAALEAE